MSAINIFFNSDEIITFTVTNNNFNVIKTQWQIYLSSDTTMPIANITTPNQRSFSDPLILNATSTLLKYQLSSGVDYLVRVRLSNGTSWTNWTQFVDFNATNKSVKLSRVDFPLMSNRVALVSFEIDDDPYTDDGDPSTFEIFVSGDTSLYEGGERTFTFTNDSEDSSSEWSIPVQPKRGTVVLNSTTGQEVTGVYTPDRNFEGEDAFEIYCSTESNSLALIVNTTVLPVDLWVETANRIDTAGSNENFVDANGWNLCGTKCYYEPTFDLNKQVKIGIDLPITDPATTTAGPETRKNYRIVTGLEPTYPSTGYLNINPVAQFGIYMSGWDMKTSGVDEAFPPTCIVYEDHPELADSPYETTGTVNRIYCSFATEDDREQLATAVAAKIQSNILDIESGLDASNLIKFRNAMKYIFLDNIRHPASGHKNGSPLISNPDIFNRSDWVYNESVPWVDIIDYLTRLRKKIRSRNIKLLSNVALSTTYADAQNTTDIRMLSNTVDGACFEVSFHPAYRNNQTNISAELSLMREFLDYQSVEQRKRSITVIPSTYPFTQYTPTITGQGTGSFSGTYSYCFIGNNGTTSSATGYHSNLSGNSVTVSSKASVRISGWPTDAGRVNIYRTTNGGSTYKLVTSNLNATTSFYDDSTADGSLGANMPVWTSGNNYYQFWEEYLTAALLMMIFRPGDSMFANRTVNSNSDITNPQWYDLPFIYNSPDDVYSFDSTSPLQLIRYFNSGANYILIDLAAASRIVATTGITTTYQSAIELA